MYAYTHSLYANVYPCSPYHNQDKEHLLHKVFQWISPLHSPPEETTDLISVITETFLYSRKSYKCSNTVCSIWSLISWTHHTNFERHPSHTVRINPSFLFLLLVFDFMDLPQFVSSVVSGQWGCFQVWVIVNKTAMNYLCSGLLAIYFSGFCFSEKLSILP